jgi:PIN domain nuclease of toxin-antitoxin system
MRVVGRIGRIDLGRSARDFFADLFSNPAYQPVDLTPEQIYVADERRPNDDPFDALICAAACHLDLPLLTRDIDIRDSGLVSVIW